MSKSLNSTKIKDTFKTLLHLIQEFNSAGATFTVYDGLGNELPISFKDNTTTVNTLVANTANLTSLVVGNITYPTTLTGAEGSVFAIKNGTAQFVPVTSAASGTPITYSNIKSLTIDGGFITSATSGTGEYRSFTYRDIGITSFPTDALIISAIGTYWPTSIDGDSAEINSTVNTSTKTWNLVRSGGSWSVSNSFTSSGSAAGGEQFTTQEKAKLASIDNTHYLPPVQNVTTLGSLTAGSLSDKARSFVEDEGVDYFYNAEATSGDVTPSGQTGGTGFWIKLTTSGTLSGADISTLLFAENNTNNLTDTLLSKLNGISSGATTNDTNSSLRDRNTHTGTQPHTTISGLGTSSTLDVPTSVGGTATNAQVVRGDDPRLVIQPASNFKVALDANDSLFTTPPTNDKDILLRLDNNQMYKKGTTQSPGLLSSTTTVSHTNSIGAPSIFVLSGTKLIKFNAGSTPTLTSHPLSTPYDVSTIGAVEHTTNVNSATLGAGADLGTVYSMILSKLGDDSKIYLSNDNKIWQFNLSVPGNLSTISYVSNLSDGGSYTLGFAISMDGTKMIQNNSAGSGNIQTHTLTSGNIATRTLVSEISNASFPSLNAFGTHMVYGNDSGSEIIVIDTSTKKLIKYTLSTANNVTSTISLSSDEYTIPLSSIPDPSFFFDYTTGYISLQRATTSPYSKISRVTPVVTTSWASFSFA